jgi:CO dehydrogenase/acetyl-CoA synthase beta subunit
MAVFDGYVAKLAQYVEKMLESGRQVKEINCPLTVSKLLEELPVRVGDQACHEIITRGDTYVEMGNQDAGSCCFLLWTNKPSLISDGKITVIGPDIQDSPGACLPFGQVLLIGGASLCQEDHGVLEQKQYISDQIEGYMVKILSHRIWARVSKDAAVKGFSFETLGRGLMAIFKAGLPKVGEMEIIFVTSSPEDLKPLHTMSEEVRMIANKIVRENWSAKGFDVDCIFDCSNCRNRPVCDEIRDVVSINREQTDLIKH